MLLHMFGLNLSILQSYQLFGHRYDVIGCINYNLEKAGGGHYITKLFPRPYDVWEVHEDSVKNVKRKPDFDTDAFIVCLKRFGKNNLVFHIMSPTHDCVSSLYR